MIFVMRWITSPIMRTAAAEDVLNRISRAGDFLRHDGGSLAELEGEWRGTG